MLLRLRLFKNKEKKNKREQLNSNSEGIDLWFSSCRVEKGTTEAQVVQKDNERSTKIY